MIFLIILIVIQHPQNVIDYVASLLSVLPVGRRNLIAMHGFSYMSEYSIMISVGYLA